MTIGQGEVRKVAQLAEIAVSDAELPRLVAQLNRIVEYVAQLDAVPADAGDAAFTAGPERVALRADEVRPVPLARPPAAMATDFIDGFFTVPHRGATGQG